MILSLEEEVGADPFVAIDLLEAIESGLLLFRGKVNLPAFDLLVRVQGKDWQVDVERWDPDLSCVLVHLLLDVVWIVLKQISFFLDLLSIHLYHYRVLKLYILILFGML